MKEIIALCPSVGSAPFACVVGWGEGSQVARLGCFQHGRSVATCGPCMNFTTFRTSQKYFQR